jgi:hypothetical protein
MVDRRDSSQAVGILADKSGDLVIVDQRSTGSPPGADEPKPDAGGVHGVDGFRKRNRRGRRQPRIRHPTPQRLEHRLPAQAGRRVLHPRIDYRVRVSRHASLP